MAKSSKPRNKKPKNISSDATKITAEENVVDDATPEVDIPEPETPIEEASQENTDDVSPKTDEAAPESEAEPDVIVDRQNDPTAEWVNNLSESMPDDNVEADLDMEIVDDINDSTATTEVEVDEPVHVEQITTVPEKSSAGFVPLMLGGVVAGVIGYAIATYTNNDANIAAQLAAQSGQIAALEAELGDIDLSLVEAQIAGLSDQSEQQFADVNTTIDARLTALDERISEVELQPSGDGTLSNVALAAYRRELENLRAELDAQQQNVMDAATQAEADLAAARSQSETLEQQAIAAAEAASARAALNRIGTAVETGAPFEDALSGLTGDIPPVLTDAAASGVATSVQLSDDFPAAARAALATARSGGLTDDAAGLGGFFRNQFDVRSTAPREGSDPDAILSRAEAAMKEGRVSDALAEIEALPEVARAEMTDWTAQATERADVLNALATLSETYN